MALGGLLILVWATACLFAPGAALLLALRSVPPVTAVAAAPAVTVGVLYVAALLGGAAGLPYGLVLVLCVWLLLLAIGLLLGRRTPRDSRPGVRSLLPRSPVHVVGAVATGLAMVIGLVVWLRGIGGIAAIPQEHDTIVHTELIAHVMRTGHAAPWQSLPADLASGVPAGFYPNGFHLYAALVGGFGPNAVVALDAAMVVLFALALPAGVAALGLRLRPRALAPLVAGSAALLAAVSYHPLGILMHDGGILSNAAALALTPGTVALLLTAGRIGWAGVLPVALAATGAVVVHPTSAVTIGLTTGVWVLAAAVGCRASRARLRRDLGVLAAGAGVGALLLIPFVLAATGVTTGNGNQLESVATFGRNVRVTTFPEALRLALSASDGGLLDPKFASAETWLAVLSLVGLAVCVILRRNAPVVAVFTAWVAFLVAFLIDLPVAPVRAASGVYYNSFARISGGLVLLQWLAAGLAVAAAVELLARLIRRGAGDRPLRGLVPLLAGAAVVALVVVVCLPYARHDVDVIALRYQNPDYNRVDAFDLEAAAFVAKRIRAGERVMNNANDGSTFGYVFYDLPVVVDQPLGSAAAPYTSELLRRFNRLGDDPHVHDLVCRLGITWAIVDDEAPSVGVRDLSWVPTGQYTVAPGLQHLERVPGVSRAARFGHVSVYALDRNRLGCPPSPAK
ncbi:MAG: DUF6541 family protein [Blastococcus sp.]